MADSAGEDEVVDAITVVGGGDAGLMTALLVRQYNPDVDVTVIDDFDDQIPQVGKSTISYIQNVLHSVLDVDKTRFVREVKPVWKGSVSFRDWCGRPPFHVPFDDLSLPPSEPGSRRFEELLYRYQTQEYRTLGVELAEQRKSPFLTNQGGIRSYDHVAYHLGTDRFNDFLRTLCRERDIDLVDDEIIDVQVRDNRIDGISSDSTSYDADLYVDATGFERLLMGSLDNEYTEFDFALDSALVAQTDVSLSDIVPATVIRTGDHGWFWQIDTYDWRDLGYVYSSAHVSREEAAREFEAQHDGAISREEMRHYAFGSGHYQQAWLNNCVAVGNALGFVEPLQSTALTLNALLTEKLSELLADHHRINHGGPRSIYNAFARTQWTNVYDFISIHYRFASGDTQFWHDMRSVNDSAQLEPYVEAYQDNGFTSHHELGGRDGPTLFNQFIFYRVLRSLGVRSAFYEDVEVEVDRDVARGIERQNEELVEEANQHLPYEAVYGSGGLFE